MSKCWSLIVCPILPDIKPYTSALNARFSASTAPRPDGTPLSVPDSHQHFFFLIVRASQE